jgi:hypothetical protein
MDPKDVKKVQDVQNKFRSQFDQHNLHALSQYARLLQRLHVRQIQIFSVFLIPGA